MPEDLFRRARSRLITSTSLVALGLCAVPAFAQGSTPPAVNDRQVQAFFNGIALDQQLAEAYASPAPPAAVKRQAAVVAPRPVTPQSVTPRPAAVPATLDEPLDQTIDDTDINKLEAEIDAAIAAERAAERAAAGGTEADAERKTIAEVPPSPAKTVLLVLASLALLAFAGSVLTLAIRELKKDKLQRKRTYRRRVKRRDSSTPVHAS